MAQKGKIIIALSNIETGNKLKSLLVQEGYDVIGLCTSGNELIRLVMQYSPDLVLVGYKFKDMSLLDVYETLVDATSFLAIVNEPYRSFIEEDTDIYCIGTKISNVLLSNAIDLIFQGKKRIKKLRDKVEKLEHTLEDRKLIEKAKGKLMSTSGITENEAFRYMQKISMDSGRTMRDIASLILSEIQ
ncbi:putative two-component response regulatory protein [Clostridium gelidum]|uniref:Stage 0 sporulation protein A homolog n=1 Tax=Clostridium gelidum TaxID=704125 RepID=A0ABN6IUK5_9CLOT|nr:ANTAR domain-containing protein [Clostridium gelidum]BCZ45253.1 putative two-component response regulatory protein [Clostridium gelidum]